MGRVEGKVALVTGAASGIGKGAAVLLAAEGASVMLTDIDDEGGKKAVQEIEAAGGKAAYLTQDVRSEARWEEVVAETVKTFGALQILVNNAGIGIGASTFEMPLEEFQRQNAINVDGVFLGCKHGIPAIAKAGGGSVINISSVAGLRGAAGMAGYCASKGAVRLMTKAIAMETAQAQMNVRVNSVHPGIIDTPIWQKIPQGSGPMQALLPEGANAIDPNMIAAGVPLGVPGTPVDIANGILYLASEESRYVTGSELVIDAGMTAN